ncbi:MAG TPA: fumarylacetoacetate hydrolase family protein [Solirubrobacteraceae bacterium]|jgi:2-keto-4-pentenoate hydratase/2-oxohepta-3-ene-1,7-dioic acid hydratase in catechol pathway
MRLASYIADGQPVAAVLLGEQVLPTSALGAPASVRELLGTCDLAELGERAAASSEPRLALADVTLAAPVPDAQKIICIGLNYRDHAEETGQEIPQAPMWFAKFQNSLCGSGADVVLPSAHPDYVDYEAELALVIGRTAHKVAAEDALAHIAGAMPFNDVSARDLQVQNPLWTSGKAVDTFAPCGPALVTLDEAGDLGALKLRTRIDGETVQEGTTANLIFGPAELVAWLSRTITLLPGDIIATGTPAGVGAAQGKFLRDGNTVEVEIDGLGVLSNPVRAE